MEICVKGAAEDVAIDELAEICVSFDRILLPTDGSAPAVAATEYAVALAKTLSATVKAIYVDTGMDALEYPEEAMTEDVYEGVHPSIKGLALAQAICERNGVGCEVEVIHGGVARRIVAVAEEWNADVIVLGDTGRTGLKRIALGSVAETVVKGSPIPVLVIKG